MFEVIATWFRRYFSDPQAVTLLCIIVAAMLIIAAFGHILAPVFASLIIAYLLQGIVTRLERLKLPHPLAVILTFSVFIGLFIFAVLGLVPLIWEQARHLVNQLPQMTNEGQIFLKQLTVTYPNYISDSQLQNLLFEFKTALAKGGQLLLSASLASIPTIIMLGIYFVVVPIMVYFFLMDKTVLFRWMKNYFPKNRGVIRKVWLEVNEQIGNYVRGRVLEIIIVSIVSYLFFVWMHLPYAMLLSTLVGFSVIIPYIGATLVTIPVVFVGFYQWGWHPSFFYLLAGYAILIMLDANVLVPLLFSGVIHLHPVAIIISILFFGGLWGFWGVFFAIPIAIVIKAILAAWPKPVSENPNAE